MHKLTDIVVGIVVYALATIGFVCVVKHIMHRKEGCYLCGWHKTEVEGSETKAEDIKTNVEKVKSTVEGLKTKVEGFKTKIHGEKRTGSRYGSSPVKY